MLDDERELSRYLMTIDADPRAAWVADLRAELAASFDVPHAAPRPRRVRRFPLLTIAIGAAAAIALIVAVTLRYSGQEPAIGPDPASPTPTTVVTTTLPTPTTAPVATAITTPPSQSVPAATALPPTPGNAALVCDPEQPMYGATYVLSDALPILAWKVKHCYLSSPDDLHVALSDSLVIEEIDGSGAAISTRAVPATDLHAVGAILLTRSYGPDPWFNFHVLGVSSRQMVFHEQRRIYVIDLDSGAVEGIDFPNFAASYPALVGHRVVSAGFGGWSCLDLDTGGTTAFASGLDLPPSPTMDDPQKKAGGSAVWYWSSGTNTIVRVDEDCSIHNLDQFEGIVYPTGVEPAPGNVWVAIEDPQRPLHPSLLRIDPDDGHALSPAVNLPEGARPDMFDTLFPSALGLLIADATGWWWLTNDTTTIPLTKPAGVTVIGVVDDRIVGYDDSGVVTFNVLDLASPAG